MSTYTQLLYQLVFTTKYQEKTLLASNRAVLYPFIWGILKNQNCHLYRIGGVEDHLHIVTHIHPSIAVADLVKDIKLSSSSLIKNECLFQNFGGWQEGYGAFTYSISAKDNLIEYVKNQVEHHKAKSVREEYLELLKEHGVEFNDSYLF